MIHIFLPVILAKFSDYVTMLSDISDYQVDAQY
jgi:hypothetical protein